MTRIERAAKGCIEEVEKLLRSSPRTTAADLIQEFGQELVTELVALGWVALDANQVAMMTGRGALLVRNIRSARRSSDLHGLGVAEECARAWTKQDIDLDLLLMAGERGQA
jgi:hypothetical protein